MIIQILKSSNGCFFFSIKPQTHYIDPNKRFNPITIIIKCYLNLKHSPILLQKHTVVFTHGFKIGSVFNMIL